MTVQNVSTSRFYVTRNSVSGLGYVVVTATYVDNSGQQYVLPFVIHLAGLTATSYTDQDVTNGTTYYYQVSAVNANGTEGPRSNEVSATPIFPLHFTNVSNGDVLSGQKTIQFNMVSANYGDEGKQVQFQVDGQPYDSGGDNQSSASEGYAAAGFFVLDTQLFANGTHTLTITDGTNSQTVTVTLNNSVSAIDTTEMFEPLGNGGLPTTANISANLGTAIPWTVSIVTTDNSAKTVKSWSGSSSVINIAWDGTDSTGTQVPADVYEVDITTSAPAASSSPSTAQQSSQTSQNTWQSIINMVSDTDVFLWMDQNVSPGGINSLIGYARAIKADLAPTKGVIWNTTSMLIHTGHHVYTPVEIARINEHLSRPLTVFYFYGHGGEGLGGDKEFSCGGSFWHSGLPDASWRAPYDTSIQQLAQGVGYGYNVNPPALVFIDSCKSGGDLSGYGYPEPDQQFGNDFDIGDIISIPGGAFLGWEGCAIEYGALPPPNDDWTFWRLDLWANFTNPNITFDRAWSNIQRDLSYHGKHLDREPDIIQEIDWASNTGFGSNPL